MSLRGRIKKAGVIGMRSYPIVAKISNVRADKPVPNEWAEMVLL
jgi:hypothetical protein